MVDNMPTAELEHAIVNQPESRSVRVVEQVFNNAPTLPIPGKPGRRIEIRALPYLGDLSPLEAHWFGHSPFVETVEDPEKDTDPLDIDPASTVIRRACEGDQNAIKMLTTPVDLYRNIDEAAINSRRKERGHIVVYSFLDGKVIRQLGEQNMKTILKLGESGRMQWPLSVMGGNEDVHNESVLSMLKLSKFATTNYPGDSLSLDEKIGTDNVGRPDFRLLSINFRQDTKEAHTQQVA